MSRSSRPRSSPESPIQGALKCGVNIAAGIILNFSREVFRGDSEDPKLRRTPCGGFETRPFPLPGPSAIEGVEGSAWCGAWCSGAGIFLGDLGIFFGAHP